jgi:type II secretory pathway pseudopilin PulG
MTLIEVMIAALILTVSLLAVAATMIQGISAMFIVQEQLVAKQKAREAMESVFTARSTQFIQFPNILGVAQGGIFLDGWQPIREMGADAIANTSDDTSEPLETLDFPGPDGQFGTFDDLSQPLSNYERRIVFSDVFLPSGTLDTEIRKITVEVRFRAHGKWWPPISVSSYISRFA